MKQYKFCIIFRIMKHHSRITVLTIPKAQICLLFASGKLDELDEGRHPYQEKEPLPPWPNNTNPNTGEVGGPRGPEPTRYGDWERKGRVTDF
jgi:hypothetical protein